MQLLKQDEGRLPLHAVLLDLQHCGRLLDTMKQGPLLPLRACLKQAQLQQLLPHSAPEHHMLLPTCSLLHDV